MFFQPQKVYEFNREWHMLLLSVQPYRPSFARISTICQLYGSMNGHNDHSVQLIQAPQCVKLSAVLAQAFGYTVPSFTSGNCNWQILYNVTVWQWKPADYYRALSLTEGLVPSYSLGSWMFWWAQSLYYQYRLECKQWKMDLVIYIQGNLVTKHNIICASIITLWESGLWFGLHGSFGAHSCRWFITLWLHACIRCLDSRNKNEQSRQDGSNEHWLLVQCSVYISSANQPLTVGWQFTHVQCKVH